MNIFDFLSELKTWKVVIRVMVTILFLLVSFATFKFIENPGDYNLKLISGVTLVKMDPQQEDKIRIVTKDLINEGVVTEIYVRALQPDNTIQKESSELIYGRTTDYDWEDIKKTHWCDIEMSLNRTPKIMSELLKNECYYVTVDDGSYIDYYLQENYNNAYVQRMRNVNSLVGYCVIITLEPLTDSEKVKVKKVIKQIRNILFL